MTGWILLALAIAAYQLILWVINSIKRRRMDFILDYLFKPELLEKIRGQYPHLAKAEVEQVQRGLCRYFLLRLNHGHNLAMPSKVVDSLWHEFILFTKDYQDFCKKAFGETLHHRPFFALTQPDTIQIAINNTWQHSCEWENINPVIPERLPLLFRLDGELDIPDSMRYSVEQGIYPKLKINVAPESLRQGIAERHHKALSDIQWQAEIEQLAPILKHYVFDDQYCKTQGGTALVPVFDTILIHEDLAIAVFSSTEFAQARLQMVKTFPDPASCGGGGCGGCGGC